MNGRHATDVATPSPETRPEDALDRRAAADLDDRLPQAARVGESAPRRRGHAGPRPQVAAGAALHPFRRRSRPSARASAFRELVRRRAEGAPVAYLVGRKEFYSLPFAVSPAVLIPRPESEFVVVEYLALTRHLESPRAVDVGHRLGLPGDRLGAPPTRGALRGDRHQRARPWRSPGGTPLSSASPTASIFDCGDRLEPVAGEGPFDAIISNPPYIPSEADRAARAGRPRLRAANWPWTAARAGSTMVARLIEESVALLKPGGHLILEIGTDQEKPVRSLIEAQAELRLAPTVYDHAKHPRVIRATRSGLSVTDARRARGYRS